MAIDCGGGKVILVPATPAPRPVTPTPPPATPPAASRPPAPQPSYSPGTSSPPAPQPQNAAAAPCAPVRTVTLAYPPAPALAFMARAAGGSWTVTTGGCPSPATQVSATAPTPVAPTPAPAAARGPAPTAAPPPSPATLAVRFWQTVPLPAPRPVIPPGYAITGKPAYLVTNGTLRPAAYGRATVLGPLHVTARGAYTVNWGDGTTTGPYTAEGRPWPNGNIAHTYDNVGRYTVTVTESWTADWSLGTAWGALGQLRTRAVIAAFPVRQVQAVIIGG